MKTLILYKNNICIVSARSLQHRTLFHITSRYSILFRISILERKKEGYAIKYGNCCERSTACGPRGPDYRCGGNIVYRITRVRRVVSPLRPFPLRLSSSFCRRLFLSVSHFLLGGLFRPCVSSLSISTVVDVSVETEDPTTPPANHAAATPSFLGKAKRKQITAQSSHELQALLVPSRPGRGGETFRSGLLHTVHLNPRDLH